MGLVQFTLTIEVDENPSNISQDAETYNRMLSDMEEVIGKSNFPLDNAEWEVI
jgi:hypothetical protein